MVVKCNQSGKEYTVKVGALSRADLDEITPEDLTRGSQLLIDYGKKSYPVTVQRIKSASKSNLIL